MGSARVVYERDRAFPASEGSHTRLAGNATKECESGSPRQRYQAIVRLIKHPPLPTAPAATGDFRKLSAILVRENIVQTHSDHFFTTFQSDPDSEEAAINPFNHTRNALKPPARQEGSSG